MWLAALLMLCAVLSSYAAGSCNAMGGAGTAAVVEPCASEVY